MPRFVFLLASIVIHAFFLIGILDLPIKTIKNKSKKRKSIVKLKTIKKMPKKEASTKKKSSLSWNSLASIQKFGKSSFNPSSGSNNKGPASSRMNLHELISSAITYPSILAELNQHGFIKAKIYIDGSGKYIEKFSVIHGNSNFLKVHVRKILRKALGNPIQIKSGHYEMSFEFILTTGLEDNNTGFNDKDLYFRITTYGGEKIIDEVNKGTLKFLESYTNFLSLLEYLPANQRKQNLNRTNFLNTYKSDPYWGK